MAGVSGEDPHRAILCDGCGRPASAEHLRRRIARLELATRFRPVHIGVLFMADAPPLLLRDYFYSLDDSTAARSTPSRYFFDAMMQGCAIAPTAGKDDAARLGEFQRRGFFLATAIECPLEELLPEAELSRDARVEEWVSRFGPTIVNRIRYSYKPRQIVLLSSRTCPIIPLLRAAGLGDRLLLEHDAPAAVPEWNQPGHRTEFCAALGRLLDKAASSAQTA